MTHASLQTRILDSDIQSRIRWQVAELIRTNGFRHCDREDLMQELHCRLLQRLPAYEPAKGSFYCFALVVLDRTARHLMETRQAACRDTSATVSLSHPHPDQPDDPTPLCDQIGPDDQARRLGRVVVSEQERWELQADVRTVVAGLPPPLRTVAEELMQATRRRNAVRLLRSGGRRMVRLRQLRTIFAHKDLGICQIVPVTDSRSGSSHSGESESTETSR